MQHSDSSQIRVEYGDDLDALAEILASVTRPGDFYASDSVTLPMPRLEVKGEGVISFPIPDEQVCRLTTLATQAPYGRGEETLLDTSVRKVQQIGSSQITLSGAAWDKDFSNLVSTAANALGCQDTPIRAELYKLLIYKKGSFFLPHRDTEKVEGMFGTLVLVLPGYHRGGQLVIRHAGREAMLCLGSEEPSTLTWCAFYADCEHEVKPVQDGSRICLVYNLIQESPRRSSTSTRLLTPPDAREQVEAATLWLREHLTQDGAPTKIVYLLDHQYSPAGLSFSGLKNRDAAVAKVLLSAAGNTDWAMYLGIVHIEEYGAAVINYSSHFGYGRRSRRYWDEEENYDEESSDFEAVTVDDGMRLINDWVDTKDKPAAFGPI